MLEREDDVAWERGWEGHQQKQLRRLASLPLAEKLKWLEEAHQVVRHLSGVTRDSVISRDRQRS